MGWRMSEITIVKPGPRDKEGWRRIYNGYANFYKREMTDAVADRVWAWITAPEAMGGGVKCVTSPIMSSCCQKK